MLGRRLGFRLACATAALVAVTGVAVSGTAGAETVLKVALHSDLKIIDPIWTTALISTHHGNMIYDTLFAVNDKLEVKPQMVDTWPVSPDKLTYSFVLRDGLEWHDGTPVTAEDCVASIRRWAAKDGMGQKLMSVVGELSAPDGKTIKMVLKEPYGLVLDSLGKASANIPFMMPKRVAETDPNTQITDFTGSGPFVFKKDEWKPSEKAVYLKNTKYKPRNEPPSGLAGGKVVKVDRVEWLIITDPATATAALDRVEVDWYETPPLDLLPTLKRNPNLTAKVHNPNGAIGIMRPNHLHPPFNNVKARQAFMHAVDQKDFMQAAVGSDPANWKVCWAFMACGTPTGTEKFAEAYQKKDLAKAKELLKESGYKGEKVVIITATDQPIVHSQSLLTLENLKKIGVNAEIQAGDWGTLITRRAVKEPIEKGGWSIFHTWAPSQIISTPVEHFPMRGLGATGWAGWYDDKDMEQLTRDWTAAETAAEQVRLAAAIQARAFEQVPYVLCGQFQIRTATRKYLTGLVTGGAAYMWNLRRV